MCKWICSLALIAALLWPLLGGCAHPTPEPVVSKQGGKLVIGLYQEPATLNIALATQTVVSEVNEFIFEPLLGIGPDGMYFPKLATEVPTVQNGGISPDGLTVTYHLKDGILWADGQPCTCDDWRFTWEVQKSPDSGVRSTIGWSDIEDVQCPDAQTIVFKFARYYAAHLQTIGGSWPFPRHATGDPAKMQEWQFNREPLGNGPFKFVEWASGDHITLARNEYYRLWSTEGKPYLDEIIIRIIPSREVGKQLIKTGELDVLWNLTESDFPDMNMEGVTLSAVPDTRTERLILNLRDPEVDAPCADALRRDEMWHWALGDVRVRQAIRYGINKQQINDKLLYGKATLGTAELNAGWAKADIPVSEYNPDKARQLLDEAGWKVGSDGLRVCDGCQYAENGRKLRLKIQTTSGDKLREQVELVLVEMMKEIGIELYIENVPSAELFAPFATGSFRAHGRFDIVMYTSSYGPDPQGQMENYYASWNIPCAENKGRGYNFHRWVNDEVDELIKLAGSNPDLEVRRDAYQRISEAIDREIPAIYLYDRMLMNAYRTTLQGWVDNSWQSMGWNSAEWWLQK